MADQSDIIQTGLRIRLFLRGLFGSRLAAHLDEELLRVRADYETRLLERDHLIADLREERSALRAKVDRYELVLLPLSSPVGQFFAPKKDRPPSLIPAEPPTKSWADIVAENDEEQDRLAQKERGEKAAATKSASLVSQ